MGRQLQAKCQRLVWKADYSNLQFPPLDVCCGEKGAVLLTGSQHLPDVGLVSCFSPASEG